MSEKDTLLDTVVKSKASPPILFNRNSFGLVDNQIIDYVFNEDGSVNWKSMIKPEFIVPNKAKTTETDISKLEDKDLIIKLGGIKDVAFIRGFIAVNYEPLLVESRHTVVKCEIVWMKNYETNGHTVEFSAIGEAHEMNTEGIGLSYLASIAENRAFVRCVRSFLRINVVAEEEVSNTRVAEPQNGNPTDPKSILEKLMKEKGIEFPRVKELLTELGYDKVSGVTFITDIPKLKVFELIEKIQS